MGIYWDVDQPVLGIKLMSPVKPLLWDLTYKARTLHLRCHTQLGYLCIRDPAVSFKKKKKMPDTTRTQEQEESNALSQNKKSIHALKSNNVFEN